MSAQGGRLPRNVKALGAVSFFTDVSSEMIYPLVPAFLSGVLGANARFIGAIEGTAEAVASLLKLASGRLSDHVSRRKTLVVLGYAIASVARPLTGFATSAGQVMAIRLTDRVGKGIRTSPRDALLADSVEAAARGRSFGFHRAADHAGAVVGPLLAFAILWFLGAGTLPGAGAFDTSHERALRIVFWLAAIPAAAALVILAVAVREAPRATRPPPPATNAPRLGRPFTWYLGALLVFTLGNSTDAFLLLRAQQLGVPVAFAPLLWAFLHVVKSAASTHAGALSDRLGRRPVILAGWTIYALVFAGFAFASDAWHAWTLFAVYGLFYALTEGTERAFVADLVPASRRGTGYGWFNLVIGIVALPASLLFGWIWDSYGAPAAFLTGAALAVSASAGLLLVPRTATQ